MTPAPHLSGYDPTTIWQTLERLRREYPAVECDDVPAAWAVSDEREG
ncbi:hypothetical protein [Neokomagataea anthophila]|uniref:Uncharacterized protein n=1 Tax=Neokomagataea anthophila TaxID=2826925 RepID=A0ABS5E848_9PROT|nr:hypothetical protein [Neokomagataea anthophila]MBR0560081.1 hypothetical protein [Neokomagataea anthophila]